MPTIDEEEMDLIQVRDEKRSWSVRKKAVYIALGAMVIIAVPLFIWLSGEIHAADKAFDALSQMLVAKDYDAAYSSASDELQNAVAKHEFIGQQTKLCAKYGSLKAVKRGSSVPTVNLSGVFTTIDATFIFERADSRFSFSLKKVGDSWRLYSYEQE